MNSQKNLDKRIQIGPKKKIAFVCSGGATKAGAFHLGVALALKEQGFDFKGGLTEDAPKNPQFGPMDISTYVGSSAGSIITTFLAAGYSLENIFNSFLSKEPTDPADMIPKILPRLTYPTMLKLRGELAKEQIKQVKNFKKILADLVKGDWESLVEFKWLKTTGIFTTDGIERFMREEALISNDFKDYLSELFIVGTQLNHSRKVVFGKFHYEPPHHDPGCQYNNEINISQAVAASTALPFIYSPYCVDISKKGKKTKTHFIDGEIRDTLSTHVAAEAGADLIFASHTHQPLHKTQDSLTEMGLPAILVQSIYLVIEQKVNAHIYNKTNQRNAIEAVSHYCKRNGIDEDHRRKICELLEAELHHRRDVDTIYIHPHPRDEKMFNREHFSLSPKKMTEVVRSGFRAAIEALRKYRFADKDYSV